MSDVAKKVETLMEAMPYLEKYQGKVIVIKYGGNAMINDELKDAVLHDVVMLKLLGLKPVLSHGGGPGINKMLEKLNIPVQFINGLRYTSEDIMRVVEMVLVGQVNTELVGRINQIGGKAVGLSGVSGDIYHCHKRSEELGFVGDKQDAVRPAVIVDTIPQIKEVAGFPCALQIKSIVGQLVDFVMGYYSERVEMNSRKRLYFYLLFVFRQRFYRAVLQQYAHSLAHVIAIYFRNGIKRIDRSGIGCLVGEIRIAFIRMASDDVGIEDAVNIFFIVSASRCEDR